MSDSKQLPTATLLLYGLMLHLDSKFILAQPPHVQHHLLLARSLVLVQRREAAPRLAQPLTHVASILIKARLLSTTIAVAAVVAVLVAIGMFVVIIFRLAASGALAIAVSVEHKDIAVLVAIGMFVVAIFRFAASGALAIAASVERLHDHEVRRLKKT